MLNLRDRIGLRKVDSSRKYYSMGHSKAAKEGVAIITIARRCFSPMVTTLVTRVDHSSNWSRLLW